VRAEWIRACLNLQKEVCPVDLTQTSPQPLPDVLERPGPDPLGTSRFAGGTVGICFSWDYGEE